MAIESRPNEKKEVCSEMLTRQEKELLEECMDELYEEYASYRKTLKKDEQMSQTYQLFLSIVKKLGLRPPKG
jgi:hypothetical protein